MTWNEMITLLLTTQLNRESEAVFIASNKKDKAGPIQLDEGETELEVELEEPFIETSIISDPEINPNTPNPGPVLKHALYFNTKKKPTLHVEESEKEESDDKNS